MKPAIILVNPQLGENIGKCARAMLNFGLTELRIVAPRDGWPNPDAGPSAAGADVVLKRAQIFKTTAEAIADCSHIFATTVRKRGVNKPVFTPEKAAGKIIGSQAKSAILFGPERSGLETKDVDLSRDIITVPINPDFGSLNLAQAVILVAYEISKLDSGNTQPTETSLATEPAPQSDLDHLYNHLEKMLDKTGFFYPPERRPATVSTLKNLLTKPGWTAEEIKTFRGILSAVEK